jgi:hypothetical protein
MSEEFMQAVNPETREREIVRTQPINENYSSVRVNDTIGTAFLGTLAILLLVFLVRSNRRNRELLLEVISLKRQA